jgi:hypothetical protein
MATLKVNVNKLNVRSSPVKDFADKSNVKGVLKMNAVFESVRTIENELGSWYMNVNGDTISAKFVSEIEGDIPPELMKYHDKIPKIFLDFHLGKLWELPMQEGLKVGIIEQGYVKKHKAIKAGITILKWKQDDKSEQGGTTRVLLEEEAEECDAEINHTTTMALIIAGDDPENGIIGVAPGVKEIYSYSLPENINPKELKVEDFFRAFEAMEQKGVNVINISFCASDFYENKFKNANRLINKISCLKDNGVVIVCATGNDCNIYSRYYPAAYMDTISVAGYMDNPKLNDTDFWNGVSICMCSNLYFDNGSLEKSNGTSGATAIMTGCIARSFELTKSKDKTKLILDEFTSGKFSQIKFGNDKNNEETNIPKFDGEIFSNLLKTR